MKVTYEVELQPEDMPVRGNAIASDDEAFDKEVEDKILARLDRGEIEAWCLAVVTARVEIDGFVFAGVATLGGCSYESEEAVKRAVLEEYDLKAEALAELKARLQSASIRGVAAEKALEALP